MENVLSDMGYKQRMYAAVEDILRRQEDIDQNMMFAILDILVQKYPGGKGDSNFNDDVDEFAFEVISQYQFFLDQQTKILGHDK